MLIKCKKCGKIIEATKETAYCPECRKNIKSDSVLRSRVCAKCGITFSGGPRAKYCPDCRAVRRAESDQQYKARVTKGQTRKLGSTDICINCGAEYVVNGARQKYCPECAEKCVRETVNAQKREYMSANADENYRKKTERYHNRRVCVICGAPLCTDSRNHSECCSDKCRRIRNRQYEQKRKSKEK